MLRGLPAAWVVWRPVYCAQIASLPQSGSGGPAFFVVDAFDGNTSGPGAGNTGLLAVSG